MKTPETDRKLIDELTRVLAKSLKQPHSCFCPARKGDASEQWIEEDKCGCWKKEAKELIEKMDGGES